MRIFVLASAPGCRPGEDGPGVSAGHTGAGWCADAAAAPSTFLRGNNMLNREREGSR